MTRPRSNPYEASLAATGVVTRARSRADVDDLGSPSGPPSRRRVLTELGSGLAAGRIPPALPRLLLAPKGHGQTVVDIPGWQAPELSGMPMRTYLRALGHDARGWGLGANTGDPRRAAARLARDVGDLADRTGEPVSLLGWSLGGVIAREVARHRPEAVRQVITYGTPLVGGSRFTAFHRTTTPGPGAHVDARTRRVDRDPPVPVPLTVIYSRRDGVVSWEACLDTASEQVEHIEVCSTHLGMGVDPDVWRLVADRLAGVDRANP